MNKFLGKIKSTLIYGGLTKEEYASVKTSVRESNRRVLCWIASLTATVFAVLLFIYMAQPIFGETKKKIYETVYIVLFTGSFLIALLSLFFAKKHDWLTNILMTFMVMLYYGATIAIGLINPGVVSVSFVVALFAAPMMFIDSPLKGSLLTDLALVTYIILVHFYKDPKIARTDIINSLIFGVLAVFMTSYLRIARFRSFVNKHDSNYDYLTGIPNRKGFDELQEKYFLKHEGQLTYGVMLDIDGFKKVNDLYGHIVGDIVLQDLAKKIAGLLKDKGIYGRTGGDEFSIIFLAENEKDGLETIRQLINLPFIASYRGNTYRYTISLGYAIYPSQVKKAYLLLPKADKALYAAKLEGKNRAEKYALHDEDINTRSRLGFSLGDFENNYPAGVLIYQLDSTKILYVNPTIVKELGYESDKDLLNATGGDVHALVSKEEAARLKDIIDKSLFSGGKELKFNCLVKNRKGEEKKFLCLSRRSGHSNFGEIMYLSLIPQD